MAELNESKTLKQQTACLRGGNAFCSIPEPLHSSQLYCAIFPQMEGMSLYEQINDRYKYAG